MTRGRIVTFYSFKGGVGRTFALANCALRWGLLARRVLVVDWDLTSPGLHHYFRPFLRSGHADRRGVIDYFSAIQTGTERLSSSVAALADALDEDDRDTAAAIFGEALSPEEFIERMNFDPDVAGSDGEAFERADERLRNVDIHIMAAGRQDDLYATRVSSFDWRGFVGDRNGRAVLEAFRRWASENYDIVLIDSRTGFDDIPALCTRVLPDLVAMCFAPNRQNIEGVSEMAELLTAIDQKSFGTRGRPAVLPLMTRTDGGEDASDAVAFASRRLATVLNRREHEVRVSLEALRVPIVPGLQVAERLAWLSRVSGAGELAERFGEIVDAIDERLSHSEGASIPALPKELPAPPAYQSWYDSEIRLIDWRERNIENVSEAGDVEAILDFVDEVLAFSSLRDGGHEDPSEGLTELRTLVRVVATALRAMSRTEASTRPMVPLIAAETLQRVETVRLGLAAAEGVADLDLILNVGQDLVSLGAKLLGGNEERERLAVLAFEQAAAFAGVPSRRDGAGSAPRRELRILRQTFREVLAAKLNQPSRARPFITRHRVLSQKSEDRETTPATAIENGVPERLILAARLEGREIAEAVDELRLLLEASDAGNVDMEDMLELATHLVRFAIEDGRARAREDGAVGEPAGVDASISVVDWIASQDIRSRRTLIGARSAAMTCRLLAARSLADAGMPTDRWLNEAVALMADVPDSRVVTPQVVASFVSAIGELAGKEPELWLDVVDRFSRAVLLRHELLMSFRLSGRMLTSRAVTSFSDVARKTSSEGERLAVLLLGSQRPPSPKRLQMRRPTRP